MRFLILLTVLSTVLLSCKNNGQKTAKTQEAQVAVVPEVPVDKVPEKVKNIIIANREPAKPDFRVLEMTNQNDVLMVTVQYSGGCEEHDFNAYFSGGWAKSLPPQAAISFEHLNPNNDNCRSLVKDTFYFNMQPLRYKAANEVVVKWSANSEKQTIYEYGE